MKLILSMGVVLLLTGCAAANISSQVRASGSEGSNLMTRCVSYTTGDDEDTNNLLEKYDGWKMIYVSEYTTSNKTNTAAIMCFEKPML
ncbi:hypothetical protein [Psychromonas sp. CD1]|uniref:hypothetical protein n=1 Tax=Psychromonas sp. CD1 TaxID=1979839 RepID=UPI000B9B1CA2|nr:hypothetical protein [Psychromonas sp. CD1]